MSLQTYKPKEYRGKCAVTISPRGFNFNGAARDVANLSQIHWMRIHTDPDERLIVFEPVSGIDKSRELLKLGTDKKGHKRLTAKGLVSQTPWLETIARLSLDARKFELKPYSGPVPAFNSGATSTTRSNPPWYIQLLPAFEESIVPSEIGQLDSGAKGIYRYLGGDNGEEVIYIGKGSVRARFEQEPMRKEWKVSRIEYSIITGDESDQKAYEWEAWWLKRYKSEHNGRLPRHNQVQGRQSS